MHPSFMLVCRVCSATALETGAAAAGGKSDLNSASRVCGLGIELEFFFGILISIFIDRSIGISGLGSLRSISTVFAKDVQSSPPSTPPTIRRDSLKMANPHRGTLCEETSVWPCSAP